jgi:hypothetical protein
MFRATPELQAAEPSSSESLQRAIELRRRGKPHQAERVCRNLLAKEPNTFDVLDWLALLRLQQEGASEALHYASEAPKVKADVPPPDRTPGLHSSAPQARQSFYGVRSADGATRVGSYPCSKRPDRPLNQWAASRGAGRIIQKNINLARC